MGEIKYNGRAFNCQINEEWPRCRDDFMRAIDQVNEMHHAISNMHQDTKHLAKLNEISECLKEHTEVLSDVRDNLVVKATEQDPRLIRVFLISLGSIALVCIIMAVYLTKTSVHASPAGGISIEAPKR